MQSAQTCDCCMSKDQDQLAAACCLVACSEIALEDPVLERNTLKCCLQVSPKSEGCERHVLDAFCAHCGSCASRKHLISGLHCT